VGGDQLSPLSVWRDGEAPPRDRGPAGAVPPVVGGGDLIPEPVRSELVDRVGLGNTMQCADLCSWGVVWLWIIVGCCCRSCGVVFAWPARRTHLATSWFGRDLDSYQFSQTMVRWWLADEQQEQDLMRLAGWCVRRGLAITLRSGPRSAHGAPTAAAGSVTVYGHEGLLPHDLDRHRRPPGGHRDV
jgi:hypothetical protein